MDGEVGKRTPIKKNYLLAFFYIEPTQRCMKSYGRRDCVTNLVLFFKTHSGQTMFFESFFMDKRNDCASQKNVEGNTGRNQACYLKEYIIKAGVMTVTFMSTLVCRVPVSGSVCGSYSCACDAACGSHCAVAADEDGERSPGKRSPGTWKSDRSPRHPPRSLVLITDLCFVWIYQL